MNPLDDRTPSPALPLARSLEPLSFRRATVADVPALVAMNHAAYPDLVEANVVYDADQIAAHLRAFPEGQIVAVRGGAIVGAISTLVVRAEDALRPHTWIEITRDGTFASHDPSGDTLYLADIYVGPEAWGTGVGPALYGALKALCVERGLARIVAGGRMWSYFQTSLTPEEYVAAVKRGDIPDRVLTSQLRAGFTVRGILPSYLKDARSRNYATLLEWVAP